MIVLHITNTRMQSPVDYKGMNVRTQLMFVGGIIAIDSSGLVSYGVKTHNLYIYTPEKIVSDRRDVTSPNTPQNNNVRPLTPVVHVERHPAHGGHGVYDQQTVVPGTQTAHIYRHLNVELHILMLYIRLLKY